jgi:hypothetical protein
MFGVRVADLEMGRRGRYSGVLYERARPGRLVWNGPQANSPTALLAGPVAQAVTYPSRAELRRPVIVGHETMLSNLNFGSVQGRPPPSPAGLRFSSHR